ncbi:hypothetical protein AVO42_11605 [Thiomicrospira sp. XS5]|uniref:type I secretion C-terminal target domain-containing protein n=1 Tax=Thiomicrospira sp. XS5 TaxID=1775636 RepID=UPI00074B016B|nr:type I secretion C-terminal target domain-containing protein [Thiomicrospira sp. XS5]KUJ75912.1 hypothetical protein AVO42_11605 [Thiomicrospira sp. XS5]
MRLSHSEYVQKAFKATLFREPTASELEFWITELDNSLTTPTALFLLGAQLPEFNKQNLPIAQLYYTLFNQYINPQEMLIWGNAIQTGASLDQIAMQMLVSNRFSERMDHYDTLEERLTAVFESATGQTLQPDLLKMAVDGLADGSLSLSDIALTIANLTDGITIGLALVHSTLYDVTTTDTDLQGLTKSDVRIGVAEIAQQFEQAAPIEADSLREEGGELLFPHEGYDAHLTVDLKNNRIFLDQEPQWLSSGELSHVDTIDARDLVVTQLSIYGSYHDERFYATETGTWIQAGNGNDILFGGDGQDQYVFESDARLNGLDTIHSFQLGAGGDVLDFSKLLQATDTSNIATQSLNNPNNQAWSNGQVLVTQGFGLDSPEEIAQLFGNGSVFAAPTEAAKAVLITADIIGHASIWALANQTQINEITSDEVIQIGLLGDVNNLSLVGFDASNFA